MNFMQQLTEWSGQLSGLLWGNSLTLIILLGTRFAFTFEAELAPV